MLKYHCPSLQPLFIYVYYIEGKSARFSLCYWCRESTGRGRCDVAKSHVLSLWQWHYRMEWFVLNHGHVLLIWGHWMTARGLFNDALSGLPAATYWYSPHYTDCVLNLLPNLVWHRPHKCIYLFVAVRVRACVYMCVCVRVRVSVCLSVCLSICTFQM